MNNETAQKVANAIDSTEGATKYNVALKSGIPRTTLDRKLAGGTEFGVYELARIAIALNVDPNDLLPVEYGKKSRAKDAA